MFGCSSEGLFGDSFYKNNPLHYDMISFIDFVDNYAEIL